MSDPFDDFANENISMARKKMLERAETRGQLKRAKKLIEKDLLFEMWQRFHNARKIELMQGEWCVPAGELVAFLESMTINDADALIELLDRQPWRNADEDTRFLVQSIVGHAIIFLREREGLPPFDDPIPFTDDDEPNASMIIREMLK
jgi:hypothetical protein